MAVEPVTPETDDDDSGTRMTMAIVKGIAAAIPLALVGIMAFVYLVTDRDLVDSFATATVPAVLLGFFAGGFIGVVRSMH